MDDVELTLLSLPTLVWYALFCYLPMFGIIIAFKKFKPIPGKNFFVSLLQSDWIGFKNFNFLFKTPDWSIMLRNTILYNLAFIFLGVFFAVSLAILISFLHSKRVQKICQTAMFLPHFLSWVVISYFVFAFLSYDRGLLNKFRGVFGADPIQWYVEGRYWPFILIILNLWKGTGYSMVVYLATITGIDGSYYEAAVIDGATKWQQVKFITLPLLTPVIVIMVIMALGRIVNSDFGLFYMATRNSGEITDYRQTIDTYVYTALMKLNNLGFASAASTFQAVAGCIMMLLVNGVIRKIYPDGALF